MPSLEKILSSIVDTQGLPNFYKQYGPSFVVFITEYYRWLETTGQLNHIARNLPDYRTIDLTVEDFINYFKNEYLNGIPINHETDIKLLIKHINDLYNSKGTPRAFKLLFNLLYDSDVNIFNPYDDVLKPSDGTWNIPLYIEVEPTDHNVQFIDKFIKGITSGSKAFVEGVTRKYVNGKYIDVFYLSQLKGNFLQDERFYSSTVANTSRILGSLSFITILNGGANTSIGEIYDVQSSTGKYGKAKVTSITNETGKVNFSLVDGGTGYTINAETAVSELVLTVNNITNANSLISGFYPFEVVEMPLANLSFISATGNVTVGTVIEGFEQATNIKHANGIVISASQTGANGTIKIAVERGNYSLADNIKNPGNTFNALIQTSTNVTASGNLVGFTANNVGLINIVNNFEAVNTGSTYIRGLSSNTYANVVLKSTGSGADFSVGSLADTETVSVNTDRLSDFNSANIIGYQIFLTGRQSGVGVVSNVVVGAQLATTITNGLNFSSSEEVVQFNIITLSGTVDISNTSDQIIGTSTSFAANFVDGNYIYVANSTAYDIVKITSVIDQTTIYVDRQPSITNTSATYGKAIPVCNGINYFANTTVIRSYPVEGSYVTGNIVLGKSSSALANITSILILGGTGYNNTDVVAFYNGGQSVDGITINNGGSGYANGQQLVFTPRQRKQLTFFSTNGVFNINDTVWQSNGTANVALGTVFSTNPLIISNVTGNFTTGRTLLATSGNGVLMFVTNATSSGSNATGTVTTNSTGGITSITLTNSGKGYVDSPIVTVNTVSGTSANLVATMTSNAEPSATLTTNSTGGITSFNVTNYGNNYFDQANVVITSAGTGANLFCVMSYGYGLPKSTSLGLTSKILNTLSFSNVTIGTIASLANIQLGTNYNINPLIQVVEPKVRSYDRRYFTVELGNVSGAFIVGETITVNVGTLTSNLTFTGILGNTSFNSSETIVQGNTSVPTAVGTLVFANSTVVSVQNIFGTFVTTSNSTTKIIGLTSNASANVTAIANTTVYNVGKGQISSIDQNTLVIKRTKFNTSLQPNTIIQGLSSGASGNIVSVYTVAELNVMGFNANVTGNVVVSSGVALTVQIIDSGFGYQNNQLVTLTNNTSPYQLTGVANTIYNGVGEGYFTTNRGMLNYAYLHDNFYYQAHSYEIQSVLSLDKYIDVVKKVLHIAGTQLFGKVIIDNITTSNTSIVNSSVTTS